MKNSKIIFSVFRVQSDVTNGIRQKYTLCLGILEIRHQTAVYQFHIEILSLCAQF